MTADYDHDHDHNNAEALALRLILACLEESGHGLNMALHDLYDTGCEKCWFALIKALVAAAATGYELIDFAEAQASADPDYHLHPARAQAAAVIIANTLAASLDEPR